MEIDRVNAVSDDWLALRRALWPETTEVGHRADMAAMVADPARYAVFFSRDDRGVVGFAEASLRTDYVNGCLQSPVVFLEGIFVAPQARRRGVAAALIEAVGDWARGKGVRELASDALIDNLDSHAMHRAVGFSETDRVVYFRKEI